MLYEEQIEEQNKTIQEYKHMLEKRINENALLLRDAHRKAEKEKLDLSVENERHIEYLRKQSQEKENLLKQAIRSLEEDKDLKVTHIGSLSLQVENLETELKKMELRLDKQVEMDQEIERELQEELL